MCYCLSGDPDALAYGCDCHLYDMEADLREEECCLWCRRDDMLLDDDGLCIACAADLAEWGGYDDGTE